MEEDDYLEDEGEFDENDMLDAEVSPRQRIALGCKSYFAIPLMHFEWSQVSST
jgi:hypothetical protein